MRLGELALRRRHPRGRVPGAARQGLGRRPAASSTTPTCARSSSPARPRSARAIMAGCAAHGEAGDARARRQERQHRLRRRRPRAGGGHRARTPCSTTPARTAAPARGSSSSGRCTTGSWGCSNRRCRASRSATRRRADTEMGPLISAAHRETVASYVPDGAPVAFRGTAPDGPGLLVPADRAGAGDARRPRLRRGDLRPGRRRGAVRRRGRRDPHRQRHAVRPVRLDLDPRRRPGAAGRAGRRDRQPVGQLALVGALLDAVRRVQAVGPRARARPRRARRLHRGQERLHRNGGATWLDATGWRAGWRSITGGGSGIGLATARRLAAEGAKVVVADVDTAAGDAAADEVGGLFVAHRRHRRASRSRRCSPTAARHLRLASTSRSTTPASRRPTTTRSSPPASTRGAGCRRST